MEMNEIREYMVYDILTLFLDEKTLTAYNMQLKGRTLHFIDKFNKPSQLDVGLIKGVAVIRWIKN